MRIFKVFMIILLSALTYALSAQELNCTVKINSSQIEGTYKQVFTTLENALSEFVNTQKWTEANFSNVERIDCSFNFNIKSVPTQDNYEAELTVQARRPVYNSVYTSTSFNFQDTEVKFAYTENEPITYNEYTIESNLVAVVSYYIYMVLGVDFDTFALNGGEYFFKKAQGIVTMCQSGSEVGWKAFDNNRNRHALVSGFLDESTAPIHQLLYDYHRLGLDAMVQNAEKGKSVITASLENLKKIKSANSTSVMLSFFLDSKLDELINIYSKSNTNEKESIYNMLAEIYPAYTNRLADIKKEKK